MNPVLDTLFLPIAQGLKVPADAVFLNAQQHPAIQKYWILQQHFKPYADVLPHKAATQFPGVKTSMVFIFLPKNAAEANYFIARALFMLEPGGTLVCAAANDAGGARLKKTLAQFGLTCDELSKNKARVAVSIVKNINDDVHMSAMSDGALQPVLDGTFMSQPGLFSWDKADKGSQLLAKHLPEKFKGTGADFGCGYGWLARQVANKGGELICIDADARAVEACKINVKNAQYQWMDLTKEGPKNLDWIVMNPPFHEGKSTDASIGRAFIETAARSLKTGGELWMVGNTQLPYERVLADKFSSHSKLYEGSGFKIYRAMK